MARPRTTPGTAAANTAEYRREYYAVNQEHKAAYHKDYRFRSLIKGFGLTVEEYERLAEQGCAVCGKSHGGLTKDGKERRLCFDHDHETGEFRGLLCSSCNTALGLADDDPDRLIALAMYLERSKLQNSSNRAH